MKNFKNIKASEPKGVNSILNTIGVMSLRLGGFHMIHYSYNYKFYIVKDITKNINTFDTAKCNLTLNFKAIFLFYFFYCFKNIK